MRLLLIYQSELRVGETFWGWRSKLEPNYSGTIRSILRNKAPIIRSDGTLVRDYIYVEDAVSAYLTLAEKLSKKKNLEESFNFPNETQKNVLELTNLLITIMGSSLKPIIQGNNNGEIKAQFLDSTKSKELLD